VKISIPELSLVLLVGPSGCGKSSFARKHFLPTEVAQSPGGKTLPLMEVRAWWSSRSISSRRDAEG
jgi:ABC-type ATPase involved in cell division